MNLKHLPDLNQFLSTTIFDADPGSEKAVVESFLKNVSEGLRLKLVAQLQDAISQTEFSVEELGTVSNRWFGEEDEARQWMGELLGYVESAKQPEGSAGTRVLDSHGAELREGDSVLTIKDLKVKGGSSDLKRGTRTGAVALLMQPTVQNLQPADMIALAAYVASQKP